MFNCNTRITFIQLKKKKERKREIVEKKSVRNFLLNTIIIRNFMHLRQKNEFRNVVVVQVLRPIISIRIQAYRWDALRGGLSKGSQPVFTRVSEKITENSERLGRQARPGLEPGSSRLPVSSVTTLPLVGPPRQWKRPKVPSRN